MRFTDADLAQGFPQDQPAQTTYGPYQTAEHHGSAFQIHHPDEGLSPYSHSAVPATRPNSAAAVRGSPEYGIRELEAQQPGGYGQETGVIGGSNVQFGPATKSYYDNDKWAMTVSGMSQEIVPDMDPLQRKRHSDNPPFIKPLPDGDFLPGLLTTLSFIPAFKAFVLTEMAHPRQDHYDPNWYSGNDLSDWANTKDKSPEEERFDVLHETQKIFAFLHATHRAYGSAQTLINLKYVTDVELASHVPATGQTAWLNKFLAAWETSAATVEGMDEAETLFSSVFSNTPDGFDVAAEATELHFRCITCPVQNPRGNDKCSLYDVLDEHIWSIDPDGSTNHTPSVEHPPAICLLHLTQGDTLLKGLNVDVPSHWYVDRYLGINKAGTKRMRQSVAEHKRKIEDYNDQQDAVKVFKLPGTDTAVDARKLLDTVMPMFRPDEGEGLEKSGLNHVDASPKKVERDLRIAEELKTICDTIDSKLEMLEAQKAMAKAEIAKLSTLLKANAGSDEPQPEHGFSLQGLCTGSTVTYVREARKAEQLIDVEETMDNEVPWEQEKDWWRIEYTNAPTYTLERVSQSQALKAASEDSRSVLLIYTQDALSHQHLSPIEIPEHLQAWIEKDNAAFEEEIKGAEETAKNAEVWAANYPGTYTYKYDGGRTTPDEKRPQWDRNNVPYQDYDMQGSNGIAADREKSFEEMSAAEALAHTDRPTYTVANGLPDSADEGENDVEMTERGHGGSPLVATHEGSAARTFRDDMTVGEDDAAPVHPADHGLASESVKERVMKSVEHENFAGE